MHLTDTINQLLTQIPVAILKWDRLITTDVSCFLRSDPLLLLCMRKHCGSSLVLPFSRDCALWAALTQQLARSCWEP